MSFNEVSLATQSAMLAPAKPGGLCHDRTSDVPRPRDFRRASRLGLIVMWRGVGRSLLSMPVRLLVSLFLGWVAASAAVIYLEVNQAGLLDRLSNQVGVSRFSALVGVRALAFIIVFIVLMLILGRIRAYLVGDDAD